MALAGILACFAVAVASAGWCRAQATTHPTTGPTTGPGHPSARVTDEAEALLRQIGGAYGRLSSLHLTANVVLKVEEGGQTHTHEAQFTSAFAAPNKFRHQGKELPLLGSTGQKVYGYWQRGNAYVQADAPPGKVMLRDLPKDHGGILPLEDISVALALSKDPIREVKEMALEIVRLPDESIDGRAYPTLGITLVKGRNVMKLLLDGQTHLVRRATVDMKSGLAEMGRGDIRSAVFTVDYTKVTPNADIQADYFVWVPPPGARDLGASGSAVAALGDEAGEDATSVLLGKAAPDFTLEALDGKRVSLSDLRGSVVVLDFWATWCGPCVMALPHLDKIHQDHGKAGLKVFAVNQREQKEKVSAFVKEHGLTIPVLLDADGRAGSDYRVGAIPTTVVIGKDGTVKKVQVGYNPEGDEQLRASIVRELKSQ